MNEIALRKISECLEENLLEPTAYYPLNSFEERSYARWTAMELMEKLMDRPYECPDKIIEDFMYKMMMCAGTTTDERKRRIFTIAMQTAEDILTLF